MDDEKKKLIENNEYGVDSRYTSENERVSEATQLMEARLKRMRNLTDEEVVKAKLVQLKFKMESYLEQPVYDNQNHFSAFLQTYIDAVYTKRNLFAADISITPVQLSQIINNHREPQDEFMMRLMIHSEKVFHHISTFDSTLWYQVHFHEKLCDTLSSQEQWRPKFEEQVKYKE